MSRLSELLKSNYTRSLEEECARLRQENRALLNSLLTSAGHPPVEGLPDRTPAPAVKRKTYFQRVRENSRREEQQLVSEVAALQRMKANGATSRQTGSTSGSSTGPAQTP